MGEDSEADGSPTLSTEPSDRRASSDSTGGSDATVESEQGASAPDDRVDEESTADAGDDAGAGGEIDSTDESEPDAEDGTGLQPTDGDEPGLDAELGLDADADDGPGEQVATVADDPAIEDGGDVSYDAEAAEAYGSYDDATYASEPEVVDPIQDNEMPLADHVEEMVKRLAVVLVVAAVVSLVVFPISGEVINFLWNSVLPHGELTRPRVYSPLALILTKIKVASLAGLIVALPVFVYETYAFMRPGLYPHERRYYLAAIPTSLVLAFIGVSFAYFLVLPAIFSYFLYYSESVTIIAFGLAKTFDLILLLMGYLALVFQIPLFVMLAVMMGLTSRRWLASRRLYFWGAFLGISFLFSPDPTGMAPIMVAATMVTLFEGTLLLLRWTGR